MPELHGKASVLFFENPKCYSFAMIWRRWAWAFKLLGNLDYWVPRAVFHHFSSMKQAALNTAGANKVERKFLLPQKKHVLIGHVCVTHFPRKGNGFPRKNTFSCVWCSRSLQKSFSTTSAFSLMSLEMEFLMGGVGLHFHKKVGPLL